MHCTSSKLAMAKTAEKVLDMLVHAACGHPAAPMPGMLSSLLLNCGLAAEPGSAACYGLTPSCASRLMLHAGAAHRELERLLEEVQSTSVLCPSVVSQLLMALQPSNMQHLSDILCLVMQHRKQSLNLPGHVSQAVPQFVQQLQQMTAVDVLLLMTLASQQQWAADVSLALLHGVEHISSLTQLSALYQDLYSQAPCAAEWLVGVGVTWACTCHVDLPQGFEGAGILLLQAAICAEAQLASSALQQVVEQLLAESAPNSHLYRVLETAVHVCNTWHLTQQREHQTPRLGFIHSSHDTQLSMPTDASVAAACERGLLEGLHKVTSHLEQQSQHAACWQAAQVATQYCRVVSPAGHSCCDVLHSLLQCAAGALHCHRHLPGHDEALGLMVKQEHAAEDSADQASLLHRVYVPNQHRRIADAATALQVEPNQPIHSHHEGDEQHTWPEALPGIINARNRHASASSRKKPRYGWGLQGQLLSSGVSAGVQNSGAGGNSAAGHCVPQQGASAGELSSSQGGQPATKAQQQQPLPTQCVSAGTLSDHRAGLQHLAQTCTLQCASPPHEGAHMLQDPVDAAQRLRQHLQQVLELQDPSQTLQQAELLPCQGLAVTALALSIQAGSVCNSLACQQHTLGLMQEVLKALPAPALQQLLKHVQRQCTQGPKQTAHSSQDSTQQQRCHTCTSKQSLSAVCNLQAPPPLVSSIHSLWQQALLMQLGARMPSKADGCSQCVELNVSLPLILCNLVAVHSTSQCPSQSQQVQTIADTLLQAVSGELTPCVAAGPSSAPAPSPEECADMLKVATADAEQLLLRVHTLAALLTWLLQTSELAAAVHVPASPGRAGAPAPTATSTADLHPTSSAVPAEHSTQTGVAEPSARVTDGCEALHAAAQSRRHLSATAEAAAVQLSDIFFGQLPGALLCLAQILKPTNKPQELAGRPEAAQVTEQPALQQQRQRHQAALSGRKRSLAGTGFFVVHRSADREGDACEKVPEEQTDAEVDRGEEQQRAGAVHTSSQPQYPLALKEHQIPGMLLQMPAIPLSVCCQLLAGACARLQQYQADTNMQPCTTAQAQPPSPCQVPEAVQRCMRLAQLAVAATVEAACAPKQAPAGCTSVPPGGRGNMHSPAEDSSTARALLKQQRSRQCLTAVSLLLQLRVLCSCDSAVHPDGLILHQDVHLQVQQQLTLLSVGCLSAAAELLVWWWRQHSSSVQSSESNSHMVVDVSFSQCSLYAAAQAAADALQQLWSPSPADVPFADVVSSSSSTLRQGHKGRTAARVISVSYQDMLQVLPALGRSSWQAACRVVQQDALVGLLLWLSCKVERLLSDVDQHSPDTGQGPASRQQTPAPDAAAAELKDASAAVLAVDIVAHVKLLAVLRQMCKDTYKAPGCTTDALHDVTQTEPAADNANCCDPPALGTAANGTPVDAHSRDDHGISHSCKSSRGSIAGIRSGDSPTSKAPWLLELLDGWLLSLISGPGLDTCSSMVTPPASANLPLHLVQLANTCSPQRIGNYSSQRSQRCGASYNVAQVAHRLCLHHSPRVYLAASVRVWGRLALRVGAGKAPTWILDLGRESVANSARLALTLLQQGLHHQYQQIAMCSDLTTTPTAAAIAAGAVQLTGEGEGDIAASGGTGAQPGSSGARPGSAGHTAGQQQLARLQVDVGGCMPVDQMYVWACEHTAAVAATCSCIELLLAYRAALKSVESPSSRLSHPGPSSMQQQQWLLSMLPAAGVCEPVGTAAQVLAAEARLVFAALSAALHGPCCAAVAALKAQLALKGQLEICPDQPAAHSVVAVSNADATTCAAPEGTGSVGAAAAAAAGATGSPLPAAALKKRGRPVATCTKLRLVQQRGRLAQARAAACQEMLCTLASLGCAVTQLTLKLLANSQQQQQQEGAACQPGGSSRHTRGRSQRDVSWVHAVKQQPHGAETLQVLHEHLQEFAAAWQGLQQALQVTTRVSPDAMQSPAHTASSIYGDASVGSTPAPLTTCASPHNLGQLLEQSLEHTKVRRRRVAMADLAAVAAEAGDSSGLDNDDRCQPQATRCVALNAAGASNETAAAAATARFHDPNVREELPYVCGALPSDDECSDAEPAAGTSPVLCARKAAAAGAHRMQRSAVNASAARQRAPAGSSKHTQQVSASNRQTVRLLASTLTAAARPSKPHEHTYQETPAVQQQQQLQQHRHAAADPPSSTIVVRSPGTAAAALDAARHAASAAKLAREKKATQTGVPFSQHVPPATRLSHPSAADTQVADAVNMSGNTPCTTSLASPPEASWTQQQDDLVDVVCAGLTAQYHAATNMVCLRDGAWITPSAFERLAGKGHHRKWKKTVAVVAGPGSDTIRIGKWLAERKQANTTAELGLQHMAQQHQSSTAATVQPLQCPGRRECSGRLAVMQQASAKVRRQQRQKQQGGLEQDLGEGQVTSSEDQEKEQHREQPAPARNSFVAACLQEVQRRASGGGSKTTRRQQQHHKPSPSAGDSDDSSEASDSEGAAEYADDDYSDLEDFIVCEPSTDYAKLLQKVGTKVSWRQCWKGAGRESGGLRR